MAMLVLVDHAAHRFRIFAGEDAVQHHLRHRDLATHRFAAGFEIDRFRQAFFRLGARLFVEQAETFGRRLGVLVVGIDLALRRDALAHLAGPTGPSASTGSEAITFMSGSGAAPGITMTGSSPGRQRSMLSGEPSDEPKNRLEVLKEKPSRGGAGASAAGSHSGDTLEVFERAWLRATATRRIAAAAARSARPAAPDRAARLQSAAASRRSWHP